METLVLNSSKINEISSIFDSYKVDINLKNLLHVEDISKKTTGILITDEFDYLFLNQLLIMPAKIILKFWL